MKVQRHSRVTYTLADDDGEEFELRHEPVEDSVKVTRLEDGGFEVRYLVYDTDAQPPENDDNAFLVHYHRDFEVRRDEIITKGDAVNWYRGDFEDYADEDGKAPENIPQAEKYHIFPVAAYIHSGVRLSLGSGKHFPDQQWDVSHVGLVLIGRDEWPEEEKAREYAEGIIEEWNQYLSGDVYGIVKETFDADREPVDEDSCWGFSGHKWAQEALLTEF